MEDFLMWAGGIIVTGIFGLIGWFINMIFARLDRHETKHEQLEQNDSAIVKALDAHRLYAAETFTTKIDVQNAKNDIMRALERMEDKIDRAQERH